MTVEKPSPENKDVPKTSDDTDQEKEVGGFENRPEPTRYGDWDVNGRCSDF